MTHPSPAKLNYREGFAAVTKLEHFILVQHIAKGRTGVDIAMEIGCSKENIAVSMTRLKRKLGAQGKSVYRMREMYFRGELEIPAAPEEGPTLYQRKVLHLLVDKGMSYEAVAERMGRSASAIYNAYHRCCDTMGITHDLGELRRAWMRESAQ